MLRFALFITIVIVFTLSSAACQNVSEETTKGTTYIVVYDDVTEEIIDAQIASCGNSQLYAAESDLKEHKYQELLNELSQGYELQVDYGKIALPFRIW